MQPEARENEFHVTDFHTGYKEASERKKDVYKRQVQNPPEQSKILP